MSCAPVVPGAASRSAPEPDAPVRPGPAPSADGLKGRRAIDSIRKRTDFLAANRGVRAAMPGFVLLVRHRDDASQGIATPSDSPVRLGITVTRKIGGAVVRNRMKRRFRALAREVLPNHAIAGADHVLIGREGGIERDFGKLREELIAALARIRDGKGDSRGFRPRNRSGNKPRQGTARPGAQ